MTATAADSWDNEETFFCCENECREYQTDQLVQLGYNSKAEPILFQPELVDGNFAIPERGTRINVERVKNIRRLKVHESKKAADPVAIRALESLGYLGGDS